MGSSQELTMTINESKLTPTAAFLIFFSESPIKLKIDGFKERRQL